MNFLSSSDFERFLKEHHPLIVDVRTPEEFDRDHLENALNIPLNLLPLHCDELDSTRTILVYCQHGVRSGQGAQFLDGKGFSKVWHLSGGLSELRGTP